MSYDFPSGLNYPRPLIENYVALSWKERVVFVGGCSGPLTQMAGATLFGFPSKQLEEKEQRAGTLVLRFLRVLRLPAFPVSKTSNQDEPPICYASNPPAAWAFAASLAFSRRPATKGSCCFSSSARSKSSCDARSMRAMGSERIWAKNKQSECCLVSLCIETCVYIYIYMCIYACERAFVHQFVFFTYIS